MTSSLDDQETNTLDEYYGQDDDDLDDFIVYNDDEDDQGLKKQYQQHEEEVEEVEEEEVEVEEVEEEEEAPVGQQEILSLREQLKAKIRMKNAAMAASAGKVNQTMPPVKDKFGTFFGPSKPILARRVIEEGCSSIMKGLQNVPSSKDAHLVSKTQPGAIENLQKPKFVSKEKRKADTLRENRDYSSLFTDDADAPPPTKDELDNRSTLVQKSVSTQVRGPIHSAGKSREPTDQPARKLPKSHGSQVAPSIQARVQSKAGSLAMDPLADRKRMIAVDRNGSSLPTMKKTPGLQSSSNGQKLQSSLQSKKPQASIPGQRQQQSMSMGQRLLHQSQSRRLQSNGCQLLSQGRRTDPSAQGQSSGQNGSAESHGRLKSAQKQLGPSSKLKASRPMVKPAVKRKSDDDTDHAFSILRRMTNNYAGKYAGRDEDISNMEADYASIQKEERRSAKLARKEDEQQLRLIEEEERRERAKKRKKVAQKQQ